MASLRCLLQEASALLLLLLWTSLPELVQGYGYTSCKSRINNYLTTTRYCTHLLSTHCCYHRCCNSWDYSFVFRFRSCKSGFMEYQTCRNALSTKCCRSGFYSSCCQSSAWWSTKSTKSTTIRFNSTPLEAIIGGVVGTLILLVIVIVVCVILCGHRSATRGRIIGRGTGGTGTNTGMQMAVGTQPTTTGTPNYPTQQTQVPTAPAAYPQYAPGAYPQPGQYPQAYPYPPPQPYPQGPPPPGFVGVAAPPPAYDDAMQMQMAANTNMAPNPTPYPPVGGAPYPMQPPATGPPP